MSGLLADPGSSATRNHPRVYILTGPQGSGKTTLLKELLVQLRQHGCAVAGIRAPVVMKDGTRIGYDIVDVHTGVTLPLCRIGQRDPVASAGPFGFDLEGIRLGTAALLLEAAGRCDLVVVDEIGPLELNGGGWAPALRPLLESYAGRLLLVVRPDILGKVLEQWNIRPVATWDPALHAVDHIAEQLWSSSRD